MKFMKLGSKPDTFKAEGKHIRYAVSDLATDVTINVGEIKFYLHKFPLLSKSNRMQKLIVKAGEDDSDEITILDIPGGPKAFEICAKFCYGMTVTLNAYNVAAARCAAEYLEMTESVDRGNLVYKIEVFLNSAIFRNWKDSIFVLQTTKSLLPWSEHLRIVGRCIDSITEKTFVDPAMICWSYTHNRKLYASDKIVEYTERKPENVPEDWWVEDVCELEIDMFKRVMSSVKSSGRINGAIIAEALRYYIARWLPESIESLKSEASGNKQLVETIIFLLPKQKGAISNCSCNFLLNILRVASLVGVDDSIKDDLVRNVSLKLHEASVKDLLVHEVELVHRMVDIYTANLINNPEEENQSTLLCVGRMIDNYLAEISRDPHLQLARFVELSELIPEAARPIHDGLYRSIDTFLKEHLDLSKAEKKKLCGLMDVRKLTAEASIHAAQNERLPLRVVVQVLYFQQIRSHASGTQPPSSDTATCVPTTKMEKSSDNGGGGDEELKKLSKKCRNSKSTRSGGGPQLMPSRSRRIFEKIWPGKAESSNKSSEISSGSSQSPTVKSSSSSSRRRRHSIS